jgi:hypothetical protein
MHRVSTACAVLYCAQRDALIRKKTDEKLSGPAFYLNFAADVTFFSGEFKRTSALPEK